MISAEGLSSRLAALDGIGVGPEGVYRLAWTDEDAATRAWFERQASGAGLSVERDPAGNLWARPPRDPPWWGVGSHLDSVRGGGRFDGPLGVAAGFEIAAASAGPKSMAVLSFADEEGARWGTPTFGSKALVGRLDLPAVLSRLDDGGVTLADAMRSGGVEPDGIADAPAWLERLAGFFEVHIDQTTELARAEVPVGVVRSLAARTRLQVRVRGRADHAGTTPRSERRDALSAAARLIVGAEDLAGGSPSSTPELTVTTSRIIATPNAPTTIAAEVRLWIDVRATSFAAIDGWRSELDALMAEVQARTGVQIELTVASRSDPREFSGELRAALAAAAGRVIGRDVPELVCFAGHDAGVLAERVPAAMLLVRNPTGISHSPAEAVELEDAAVAARVVAEALELVA